MRHLKGGKLLLSLSQEIIYSNDFVIDVNDDVLSAIKSKGLVISILTDIGEFVFEPSIETIDVDNNILYYEKIKFVANEGENIEYLISVDFGDKKVNVIDVSE